MGTKRVFLTGASGQVGQALRHQVLPADWELIPHTRAMADITNHRAMREVLHSAKPDLVINAAAMTAVDACETDPERAEAVNFDAVANLAAQCAALDAPLIQLSTDYVFDGTDGEIPYKPNDPMNPLNMYGKTKLMGEEAVRHGHSWSVILRVSSVFSAFGTNLLTKALQTIDQKEEIKAVTDQKTCPTPAQDVARALITITNALLTGKSGGFGTFHFCGEGVVTRFQFMQEILQAYAPFTTKRPSILPALSSDFPGFAVRPAYSVLDCSSLREVYGIHQRPWQEGLAEAMQLLMQDRRPAA